MSVEDPEPTVSRRARRQVSGRWAVVVALPPVAALVAFYSMALHMYLALGRWPTSIGTRGFSEALMLHDRVQMWTVLAVWWLSVLAWPLALGLCAVSPRWRRFLPYLLIYAGALVVCCALMACAPSQFLYWWRD